MLCGRSVDKHAADKDQEVRQQLAHACDDHFDHFEMILTLFINVDKHAADKDEEVGQLCTGLRRSCTFAKSGHFWAPKIGTLDAPNSKPSVVSTLFCTTTA